jgi:hypothetical protein
VEKVNITPTINVHMHNNKTKGIPSETNLAMISRGMVLKERLIPS